jgi:hypothetical protein
VSTAHAPDDLRQPLGPAPSAGWAGWVMFAGILIALTGVFDFIQGLVALTKDEYFVVSGGDLLLFDFTTWGWILMIWGAAMVLTGFALLGARGWARWLSILLVCVNAVVQLTFIAAFPIWSTIVIALNVFVLFALTARWDEAKAHILNP